MLENIRAYMLKVGSITLHCLVIMILDYMHVLCRFAIVFVTLYCIILHSIILYFDHLMADYIERDPKPES